MLTRDATSSPPFSTPGVGNTKNDPIVAQLTSVFAHGSDGQLRWGRDTAVPIPAIGLAGPAASQAR